jgi:hypothetical protein
MGRFLDRYRQGEQKQVWDELLAQGEAVRQEPLLTDASAVVHETMQRVRHNIEVSGSKKIPLPKRTPSCPLYLLTQRYKDILNNLNKELDHCPCLYAPFISKSEE